MNQTYLDKLTEILDTPHDVKSFYENFLAVSANMSGAQMGVAWRGTTPPFQPICQVQNQSASVTKLSVTEEHHNNLLKRAVKSEQAFIELPKHSGGDPLMFGSIHRGTQTDIVEFVLPRGETEVRHREILDQLDSFCSIATQFKESSPGPASDSNSGDQLPQPHSLTRSDIDQYSHEVHGSIDFKETASRVANEMRRVLDCDRVSVLLRQGSRYHIVAISGQASVNRRSNAVKLLSRLAARTLKTNQRFWYPDPTPLPPQIETTLNDYLNTAATRTMAILPIFDRVSHAEAVPQPQGSKRMPDPKVVAGVVVEYSGEQWDRQTVGPSIDMAARHAGDAIRNSLLHKQLFLYPLWRMLGKSRVVMAARNLPKTLAAIAAVALLTAVLCLFPVDFTLPCDGVLQPQQRARIYTAAPGRVNSIDIRHGDTVAAGQVLLQLDNEDIEVELESVNAEISRQLQRLQQNKTSRSASRSASRSSNRNSNTAPSMDDNAEMIEAELETLNRRRDILVSKSEKLNLTSPIDGNVITWDVENRLKDRPVSPGDSLLEVVSVEGPWQLELQLPDRRVGHFLNANKDQDQSEDEGLQVSYQLAAEPGVTFHGHVREYSQSSQMTADKQQTIRVLVDIDSSDLKQLKYVDGGVTAKIHCGRRSLGYVWLHDVGEFFQAKVFFKLW